MGELAPIVAMRLISPLHLMSFIPSGKLLVRNTLLNLVGQALPLVVAVLSMPYVMHGMGAERFGVLSLIWVVLSVLTVFDFGLSRATTKLVAECLGLDDRARAHGTIWSTLLLQLILGVVGMFVMAALAPVSATRLMHVPPNLVREVEWSIVALSLSVPLHLAYSSLRGALEAAQRFDLVILVRSPLVAGNFLVPTVGVLLQLSLPATVLLFALVRVIAVAIVMLQCAHVFPGLWSRPRASRRDCRAVLGFGGWVAISSVVSPTLVYMDRVMLGIFLPIAALGHYTVAHETITRLSVIPSSLVGTLYPAFSAIDGAGHKHRLEALASRSIKYLLFILGPVAIVLGAFAPLILSQWMGNSVAASASMAFRLLAIGILVNGLAYVPFSLLQAVGRPDLTAKAHLSELPLQFVVVTLLVRTWGISGAAAAWTIRVAFDAVVLYVLAFRVANLSGRALVAAGLPKTFAALAALSGVALLVSNTSWSPIGQGLALAICAIPALLSVWLWLLDSRERAQILGALARRRA